MLDYSSCENYLKQLGYISSNDSIGATKIDYNPSTIYPQQSDIQASSTISFSLFTSDCKKVDLDLCKNLTTKIDIAISGNLTSLNLSQYDTTNPLASFLNCLWPLALPCTSKTSLLMSTPKVSLYLFIENSL